MRSSRRTDRPLFALLLGLMVAISPQARAQSEDAKSAQLAVSNDRDLLLEVWVNGVDTGKVAAFHQSRDALFAAAHDLVEVGIRPPESALPDAPVNVAGLDGAKVEIDEAGQQIRIVLPVRALVAQRIDVGPERASGSRETPLGALVTYDITATGGDRRVSSYAYAIGRVFGRFGVAQSDVNITQTGSRFRAIRLMTSYTYTDEEHLRNYSVGDVISGSTPYSRSLRIGGLQASTNFAIRPDLITYPLPMISGGSAVPSTVDVLVNGVSQLSQAVSPGPFYIPQLPVVSGAGQVSVSVRDAAGRQSIQTSSFYATSALLRPGLAAWSAEIGGVRRNYGTDSANYGPASFSGSGRLGISSRLTIDGHGELSKRLELIGGGLTYNLADAVIVSAAATASQSLGRRGVQGYLALERATQNYRLGVSAQISSRAYRDLGSFEGDPVARHIYQANAGVVLGAQGSLGVSFTDIEKGPAQFVPASFNLADPTTWRPSATRTKLLSASYTRDLFGRANAYVTGLHDFRHGFAAIMAGITVRLGRTSSASASFESRNSLATVEAGRPVIDPGDVGGRVYVAQGSTQRELVEGRYRGSWGEVGLGADHIGGSTFVQANARGSVAIMNGAVMAANYVGDGFAVVDTAGIAGAKVELNNRVIGQTNRRGNLLVPGLLAYQPNKIALDATSLPLDAQWEHLEVEVAPAMGTGAVARFGLRRVHSALLVVRTNDGAFLPVGTAVDLAIGERGYTVAGFEGQVFFPDVAGRHILTATMTDGRVCSASVDFDTADLGERSRTVNCRFASPTQHADLASTVVPH